VHALNRSARTTNAANEVNGFSKRRCTWYRRHPDTILVLDLQKSEYGGQYYINLAVALRALNPDEYPRENKCDIRLRLDDVVDDTERMRGAFDLEDRSITADERAQYVRKFLEQGAKWLQRQTTLETIGEELRSNASARNRTMLQARRFLKID